MRLDRRGFDEAHGLLNSVHLYQHGHRQYKGASPQIGRRLTQTAPSQAVRDAPLEMRLAYNGGY
jgi:hypothetical protein